MGSILVNEPPSPSSKNNSKPIKAHPPSSTGADQTKSIVVYAVAATLGGLNPVGAVQAVKMTGSEVSPSPLKFTADRMNE